MGNISAKKCWCRNQIEENQDIWFEADMHSTFIQSPPYINLSHQIYKIDCTTSALCLLQKNMAYKLLYPMFLFWQRLKIPAYIHSSGVLRYPVSSGTFFLPISQQTFSSSWLSSRTDSVFNEIPAKVSGVGSDRKGYRNIYL